MCLTPVIRPEGPSPGFNLGLTWVSQKNVPSPHKALLRCALEKNTRRARVGGAEGAYGPARIFFRSQRWDPRPFSRLFWAGVDLPVAQDEPARAIFHRQK